jgi:hypothetical protein
MVPYRLFYKSFAVCRAFYFAGYYIFSKRQIKTIKKETQIMHNRDANKQKYGCN